MRRNENVDWAIKQNEDQNLRIVKSWVIRQEIPDREHLKDCNIDLQRYAKIFPKLQIITLI